MVVNEKYNGILVNVKFNKLNGDVINIYLVQTNNYL